MKNAKRDMRDKQLHKNKTKQKASNPSCRSNSASYNFIKDISLVISINNLLSRNSS